MTSFQRTVAGLFGRTRALALLTIRRGAYARALAPLPRIDRPALVVGASPGSHLPAGQAKDWFLVSINASQTGAEDFGFAVPDLTVFRDGMMLPGKHQDAAWNLLRDHHTKHLAPLWASWRDHGLNEVMARYNYTADQVTVISRYVRSAIILELTGSPMVNLSSRWSISNGLFATLLALKLGASPVVLTGFSFSDPSYKVGPSVNLGRPHLWGDRLMISRLIERGLPVYAAEAKFAEESGLRLWDGGAPSPSMVAVRDIAL